MAASARPDYRVPFRPPRFLGGGHRQTLAGYLLRRSLRWPYSFEDMVVEAGDRVRLVARATWQERSAERPSVVIVHGLGGSSESSYAISTGRLALSLGWNVVRMNMRGAGASGPLCPLLYNAGQDLDVVAVARAVAERTPCVALLGFSLGANLAVLAAARGAGRLPVGLLGVVAVSPPLDLAAGVAALARPGNRLYQRHYVRQLQRDYRSRQQRRPDLYSAGAERGVTTVREFDERITAPHGGFRDADDYYARSSGGPWLGRVERPTLVISAADDPLIPVGSVTPFTTSANARVRHELLATGGHVGFVARSQAPGFFWAADRALAFLGELPHANSPGAAAPGAR
jgi:predicted alpha/beta-fold hydrolase